MSIYAIKPTTRKANFFTEKSYYTEANSTVFIVYMYFKMTTLLKTRYLGPVYLNK